MSEFGRSFGLWGPFLAVAIAIFGWPWIAVGVLGIWVYETWPEDITFTAEDDSESDE